MLRIGGDSTDGTWWPIRGMIPPGGIYYRLTDGWLRITQALAADLDAKLILGINLAAGRPAIAAAEGRAFLAGDRPPVHRRRSRSATSPTSTARSPGTGIAAATSTGPAAARYDISDYSQEFARWSKALPNVPLAGPAVSGPAGWASCRSSSQPSQPRSSSPTTAIRCAHASPIPPIAGYPSIPNLLADSSLGRSRRRAGTVRVGRPPPRSAVPADRDQLGFVRGRQGVTDTFASALWALDTLFDMASVGVDGVNVHMLPGSNYELFTVSQTASGTWQAFVHPEYYGLLMFAQAFPPGAHLLQRQRAQRPGQGVGDPGRSRRRSA